MENKTDTTNLESTQDTIKNNEQLAVVPLQQKSHTALALLLLLLACALGAWYVYMYKVVLPEPLALSPVATSTPIQTDTVPVGGNVVDITGKTIPSITRDQAYYDFSSVMGKDHNLPFVGSPATGNFVFDQERNYMFRLDKNWKVASITPTLPKLFANPRYTIQDSTNQCYVTFAERLEEDPSVVSDYVQMMYSYGFASVSETQMTAQRTIEATFYPGDPKTPRNFEVTPWRPYLVNEFSYTHAYRMLNLQHTATENVLVLHAKEGAAITKECDEAFVGMLRTLEPWYQSRMLSATDVGELSFVNEHAQEGSVLVANGIEGYVTRVLFDTKTDARSERTELMALQNVMSSQSPTIYKNTLYYLKNHVGLVAANLFSGTQKTIVKNIDTISESNTPQELTVNDYFMSGDTLYTLQGVWCNEYKASCAVNLVVSALDGTNQVVLAENLPYRDIVGFDATEKRLYLRYMDGDAGCMWGQYDAYDFTTKAIVTLQNISGCYGETDEAPSGVTYMEKIAAKFESQVVAVHALSLENGLITPVIAPENEAQNGYMNQGERIRFIFP